MKTKLARIDIHDRRTLGLRLPRPIFNLGSGSTLNTTNHSSETSPLFPARIACASEFDSPAGLMTPSNRTHCSLRLARRADEMCKSTITHGLVWAPRGYWRRNSELITVQSRDLENGHFYAFLKNANAVRGVGAPINSPTAIKVWHKLCANPYQP